MQRPPGRQPPRPTPHLPAPAPPTRLRVPGPGTQHHPARPCGTKRSWSLPGRGRTSATGPTLAPPQARGTKRRTSGPAAAPPGRAPALTAMRRSPGPGAAAHAGRDGPGDGAPRGASAAECCSAVGANRRAPFPPPPRPGRRSTAPAKLRSRGPPTSLPPGARHGGGALARQ